MLALLFNIGPEPYAVPARIVVEVVPRVQLRPVPQAPTWLAGVFAYRGEVLPVVDLCRRLLDGMCPGRMSSRIVVVQQEGPSSQPRCGMLAERVSTVRQLPAPAPNAHRAQAPFVAGTVLENGRLIHILDVEAALSGQGIAGATWQVGN